MSSATSSPIPTLQVTGPPETELLLDADPFNACLAFLEQERRRHAPGSLDDNEFRDNLTDTFRRGGAPVTLVKELRNVYKGGPIGEATTDVELVVGLLMFLLKEDSCLPVDEVATREKLLEIADEAFKQYDESLQKTPSRANSIPTTVQEEEGEEGNQHGKRKRSHSSSSSSLSDDGGEVVKTRKGYDDDNDDDDDDNSSSSSDSTSRSRKEMNRLIGSKQYVSLEKIASVFTSMQPSIRRRVDPLVSLLHATTERETNDDSDAYVLSEAFAPMFSRPPNTAYMSIRHLREVPRIRLVLWVWIDSYDEIVGLSKEPYTTKSAASTPPPSRHSTHHPIKPRLSSVSSGTGVPYSPPQFALHIQHLNSLGQAVSENAGAGNESLNKNFNLTSSLVRHVRRKTPPRISETANRRRVDLENIESYITSAVDLIFAQLDGEASAIARFQNWIAEEVGSPYSNLLTSLSSLSLSRPASISSEQINSLLASGKRQWATKERVTIEKRVLKKRLLHWDKEFERKNKRKPTREDRAEIKGVFHAYGALKSLLAVLEAQSSPGGSNQAEASPETLLLLEKRALQAVLKLFEKDFEERMGRKVEVAADIAGRELEYSRYKELKEALKGVTA